MNIDELKDFFKELNENRMSKITHYKSTRVLHKQRPIRTNQQEADQSKGPS